MGDIVNRMVNISKILLLGVFLSTEVSATDTIKSDSTSKIWKFAVRVAGVYDVKPDERYEILRSGYGYNIEALLPLHRNLAIFVNFARTGLETVELPKWPTDDFESYASTLQYSATSQTLGIRYTHLGVLGWKSVGWHLDLGLGKADREYEGYVELVDRFGQPGYRWKIDTDDPEFLVEWELGLQKRMCSSLAIELGFRRYMSFTKSELPDDLEGTRMIQTWGFLLGLTAGIPAGK